HDPSDDNIPSHLLTKSLQLSKNNGNIVCGAIRKSLGFRITSLKLNTKTCRLQYACCTFMLFRKVYAACIQYGCIKIAGTIYFLPGFSELRVFIDRNCDKKIK
ncbi:hypothetical protein V8G54_026243, partial [Vigna mungo]